MDNLGYDRSSAESILEYARKLTYKSLAQCVDKPLPENLRNRGDLGSLVEKYYFKYEPNSDHRPDFAEAGVELKTTGVLPSTNGGYKAKERLVLTMINFTELTKENWETSSFLAKCQLMLILFYLYQRDVAVIDRKFVLEPLLFRFPPEDLVQIRRDWEFIRAKVEDGRAHELSEGDTFYLGACRKGSGGISEKLVKQPNSTVGAKSRAFSLKQSYLNQIIASHSSNVSKPNLNTAVDFASALSAQFAPYIGRSVDEIASELNMSQTQAGNKRHHRSIAERILATGESKVSELAKAGIEMKTIRLNSRGKPRESMSFPGFSFLDILNEEWEDSKFFEKIERKFLLVVFGPGPDGIERLAKVGYWNMPYLDRLEAEKVWKLTQSRLSKHQLPLPQESESTVAHVRPKAANGADKAPLPSGELLTKQAFWLNKSYIANVVSNL